MMSKFILKKSALMNVHGRLMKLFYMQQKTIGTLMIIKKVNGKKKYLKHQKIAKLMDMNGKMNPVYILN